MCFENLSFRNLDDDSLRHCLIYVIERALRKRIKVITNRLNFVQNDFIICQLQMLIIYLQNGIFDLPESYKESPLLVNPITFAEIVEKGRAKEYANPTSLLLDFKWLRHNCEILYLRKFSDFFLVLIIYK